MESADKVIISDRLTDQIIAYENDDLSMEETVNLFQELINSGLAWSLQGHYGRIAESLIQSGLCLA
jgi:hypothetical protein